MKLLTNEVETRGAIGRLADPKAPRHFRAVLSGNLWLGLTVFVVDLAVALYLSYGLHYVEGDALSRVASAYYVFFSRDPHLADIGFVWNPLPSLLELPLILLKPLYPAIAARGLAGDIVSALFEAVGVTQLVGILESFEIPNAWRIVAASLYALNPLILLYAANGMSDLMLLTAYLGTFNGIMNYFRTGSVRALTVAGLWLAVGFGVRYEAVPFSIFLTLGLVVALLNDRPASEIRATIILLLTPIVYAASIWMYFNWAIMKNPLYFIESPYGNAAQTGTGQYLTPGLVHARHNMVGTLIHVAHFSLLFWPAVIGLLGALVWAYGRRRDPRVFVLWGGMIGAVALEAALTYLGKIASWDRFYLSYIPMGVVSVGFVASKLACPRGGSRRPWVFGLMAVVLLLGDAGTWGALRIPELSHPDGQMIYAAVTGKEAPSFARYTVSPVVSYLNQHPHLLVLVDAFTAEKIILQVRNPKQLIITSDQDFESILHNPLGRVNAFLLPKPVGVANLSAIDLAYPHMWAGHVKWTRLIKTFSDPAAYRLYAILPNAP